MSTPIATALWLLRRITGYRLRHVLAAAFVMALGVAAATLAFWWLGQRADAAIGFVGVLAVALAYLCSVALGLGVALYAAARVTAGRVRRRAAPLGFSRAG
jgi:fucose 4-O-acetylase-like acetyltransferase